MVFSKPQSASTKEPLYPLDAYFWDKETTITASYFIKKPWLDNNIRKNRLLVYNTLLFV